MNAYFLIGPSGAGKSTFTRELMAKYDDVSVFSLDTCRLGFFRSSQPAVADPIDEYRMAFDYANQHGRDFDAFVNQSWRESMQHSVVVIDNTNLTRKSRARWVQDLRKKGAKITMVEFMVPLHVVKDRQSSRADKSVPLDAVVQHYMRQESVHLGVECDSHMVVASS